MAGSYASLNPAALTGQGVNTKVLYHLDPHADDTSCRRERVEHASQANPPGA